MTRGHLTAGPLIQSHPGRFFFRKRSLSQAPVARGVSSRSDQPAAPLGVADGAPGPPRAPRPAPQTAGAVPVLRPWAGPPAGPVWGQLTAAAEPFASRTLAVPAHQEDGNCQARRCFQMKLGEISNCQQPLPEEEADPQNRTEGRLGPSSAPDKGRPAGGVLHPAPPLKENGLGWFLVSCTRAKGRSPFRLCPDPTSPS